VAWTPSGVAAESVVDSTARGPYAPGLLAIREGPALAAAVDALPMSPDLLLVNATGRDHPRRAGLAFHLGAALGVPTVGVTHRPLLAKGPWPPEKRGASSPLCLAGEPVGAWLRTQTGIRPVAVTAGWRTSSSQAVELVMGAVHEARTPEPIRLARRAARTARSAAHRTW
jgi:deoxyribonuclease V